jgi:hypothetical protein
MTYYTHLQRSFALWLVGFALLACGTTNSIKWLESRLHRHPACQTDEECRDLERAAQRLFDECQEFAKSHPQSAHYEGDCAREQHALQAARATLLDQFRQHSEQASKEERDKLPLVVTAENDGANHISVTVAVQRECRVTREGYVLTGWSPCGAKKIAGAKAEVIVPGYVGGEPQRVVSVVTDAAGRGTLDLSGLEISSDQGTLTIFPPQGESRIIDVPLRRTATRRASKTDSGNASDSAWAEARQSQAELNAAALDDAEVKIKTLEQTKEPWGDGELNSLARAGTAIRDAIKRLQDAQQPLDPKLDRLSSRWQKLSAGPGKRTMVLIERRNAEREAERARQEKEAARRWEGRVPIDVEKGGTQLPREHLG